MKTFTKPKPAPLPVCHISMALPFNQRERCLGSICSAWDPAVPAESGLGTCGLNPALDRKAWLDPTLPTE